jgi:hypothetical protein
MIIRPAGSSQLLITQPDERPRARAWRPGQQQLELPDRDGEFDGVDSPAFIE